MNQKFTKSVVSNEDLVPIFSLGELYVSDFLDAGQKPKFEKSKLELGFDPVSKLVQLTEQPSKEAMWGSFYWYLSATNPQMQLALKDVAEKTINCIPNKENSVYLDIASNDGTLLSFVPNSLKKVGIDPSKYDIVDKFDNICDYFSADVFLKNGYSKARYISCCAMFYDLDNPNQFLKDIYNILEDDGIFVLQMSYTPLMILQMELGNMCFPQNTLINGANKYIQDIRVGDITYNKDGKMVKVKNTFKHDYTGKMVNIKPCYLDKISVTPEHPILTINKKDIESKVFEHKWKKANDITFNDYLVIPKIKPSDRELKFKLSDYWNSDKDHTSKLDEFTVNEEIAWLFGIWTAEGSINQLNDNATVNFTLNVKEIDYQNKIIEIFEKEFNYKLKFYKNRCGAVQGTSSFKKLAHFLVKEFGRGAMNKNIPQWLMTAPDKIKISFLKGLFAGDGYYKNSQIHLHSASKILCLQVQLLLASLGAMTGITWADKAEALKKDGEIIKSKESWQIRGKSKKISKLFGLDDSKNKETNSLYYETDDNFYVKIRTIESKDFSGEVYNFETETNTYMVSNFAVHNCQEHLCYYNLTSLKYLFDRNGFNIKDVELNNVNGGSIRVYLQKDTAPNNFKSPSDKDISYIKINSLLEWEQNNGYNDIQVYLDFFNKINELKEKTTNFIKEEKQKGKTIFGYGASTKASTVYQYFGLDSNLITKIAEKQERKWGKYTIGTNIPICSDEEMRASKPDYLLVGPWFFLESFKKRESEFLKNGGAFILTSPEFTIYKNEG